MISYSITKTISIDAPVRKVFDFLANLENWQDWAIATIEKIQLYDGEWWEAATPVGSALLRLRPNATFGTLDHDFDADDASWTVPARVVPNGTGSEVMITLMQPRGTSLADFEEQLALVGGELEHLKRLMETT